MAAASALWRYSKPGLIFKKCILNPGFSHHKYPGYAVILQKWVVGCFIRRYGDSTSRISDENTSELNADKSATNEDGSTDRTISDKQESSESKLLRVAIIGEPNSGKSTLTNRLIGEKICAVTAVPHTTRRETVGVFMMGNSQIILLDTPGVVTRDEARRLKMTRQHMLAPRLALEEADLIAVITDASDRRRRLRIPESILVELQHHQNTPSVLIINKIDNVNQKSNLLDLANTLIQDREKDKWGYKEFGGWGQFEHVFMVSAKTADGVEDLKQYFAAKSKDGDWLYPPELCTDQSIDERIKEIFREKLLEVYEHEIPWQTQQVSVLCEPRDDHWRIHHKLYCRKKSQRRCVLEEIDRLRGLVLAELEHVLGQPVELTVEVGVSEKVGFQTPLHTF